MLYWIAQALGFPHVLNLVRYQTFRSGAAVATRRVTVGGPVRWVPAVSGAESNCAYCPGTSSDRLAPSEDRADSDPAPGSAEARLAAYEEPPMDPAIREELAAFVARRKEEGGAPTDF